VANFDEGSGVFHHLVDVLAICFSASSSTLAGGRKSIDDSIHDVDVRYSS
jgi:hypothetical protein